MSAKRAARLPVRPKSNGDNGKYLDYVSRAGTKTIAVGSGDEMAIVQAQLGGSRVPRDYYNPPQPRNIIELNPGVSLTPLGKKWCSNCGEWVKKEGFSPKLDAADNLHPHCKSCRAEHSRKMYWLKKESAVAMPIAA